MRSVVYIDVLFVLNMFINYFLLAAVAKILRITPSRLRLLCGALLGGMYSLFIFLPEVNTFLSLAAKLIFSVSIVFASFKQVSARMFFKLLAGFYIINFVFAGIMLAVWFAFKPPGLIINNGVVYFDVSFVTLTISTIVCYIIVTLTSKVIRRNAPDNKYYDLSIEVGDNVVSMKGIVDTGNSLYDAFTDRPVIVADYKSVKNIFNDKVNDFFNGGLQITEVDDDKWRQRLRLIPYRAVGKEDGLLPAFKPDGVTIRNNKKQIKNKDIIIAVSKGALPTEDFSALINPRIIN